MKNEFAPPHLSVSCVFYDTDEYIYKQTLNSLHLAIEEAKKHRLISKAEVHLINNNPSKETDFFSIINSFLKTFEKIVIHNGHGNIGYGRGNNLAISQIESTFHLILNPDVELSIESITEGLKSFETYPEVALLAPHATNKFGEIEYLAKRRPSPFTIFLRGLNNGYLNKIFSTHLDSYAYKDKIPTSTPFDIELASGCFMLCRTAALIKVNGFSDRFFLYFEDFDLSEKIQKHFKIRYIPHMKIQHLGGHTRTKKIKHHYLFLKSALMYFLK